MTTLTKLHGTNTNDVINILDGFHDPFLSYEVHGLQGNDLIIGGFGDDSLYGDQGNDTLMGLYGSNILDGGSGDDQLFGFSTSFGTPTNPFVIQDSSFVNAPNILFGGDGSDILVGSVGIFYVTVANEAHITLGTGGFSLYGGNGDDQLFGLYISLNDTTTDETGLDETVYWLSNTLDGDNGDDHIVGNINLYTVLYTNTELRNEEYYLGNTLLGGSGNDTLIGNYGTLNFTLNVTGNSNNFLHLGNDILNGSTGDDLLIGDIQSLSIVYNGPGADELHYGNDTLIGGQGNDTLIGDVQNIVHMDGSQFFGNDTFVFAIGGKNGNDTIKDMNAGGVQDTLQFSGAGSVAAVDAASTFTNSGGHVLMSFAGGSVLFENIAYTGQHSVLDVTPHVVVV
jgi:Ca2+-binding RTX toxin-like protein